MQSKQNADSDRLVLVERIKNEIVLGESQFREFKSALQGKPDSKSSRRVPDICRDIAEACVSFANADGGVLLIGVEDSGEITGVPHSTEEILLLLDSVRTHVHGDTKLPIINKAQILIDGKILLYFAISKSADEVCQLADGRCVARRDRETVPISPKQIHFERSEIRSREYDRQFVDGASVNDLDRDLVQSLADQYLRGLSIERFLQQIGLAEYSDALLRLRRAAILLFARDVERWHPGCSVRLVKISGTELRFGENYNAISDEFISGNVYQLLIEGWDKLRPFLAYKTEFGESARFEQRYMYPEAACQEALVNALAHRDYVSQKGVSVFIFDDRIEIRSPGLLLSTIHIDELRKGRGIHESRNSLIARVLREAKIMRELGEGIRRIFELMEQYELQRPKFMLEGEEFTVVMSNKSVFSAKQESFLSLFEDYELSALQKRILILGINGSEIAPDDIYSALNTRDRNVYDVEVTVLRQKGLLQQIRTNADANRISKERGITKGKIPRFKVDIMRDKGRYSEWENVPSINPAEDTFVASPSRSLYAYGFPQSISDERLLGFFEVSGTVEALSFPRHKLNAVNRHFCFVRYSSVEEADKAIKELNRRVIDGDAIHVRRFVPPNNRMPSSSRRRR